MHCEYCIHKCFMKYAMCRSRLWEQLSAWLQEHQHRPSHADVPLYNVQPTLPSERERRLQSCLRPAGGSSSMPFQGHLSQWYETQQCVSNCVRQDSTSKSWFMKSCQSQAFHKTSSISSSQIAKFEEGRLTGWTRPMHWLESRLETVLLPLILSSRVSSILCCTQDFNYRDVFHFAQGTIEIQCCIIVKPKSHHQTCLMLCHKWAASLWDPP